MSIKVAIVPVTAYQQNCSIVKCEATGKLAIVDPGGDIDRIMNAVAQIGGTVEKILLTHGHMDHCAASAESRQKLEIPIEGPGREDAYWIDKLPESCQMAGMPPVQPFEPDRWLEEGDTVTLGELNFQVFHCPGHTPALFYLCGVYPRLPYPVPLSPHYICPRCTAFTEGYAARSVFPYGTPAGLILR